MSYLEITFCYVNDQFHTYKTSHFLTSARIFHTLSVSRAHVRRNIQINPSENTRGGSVSTYRCVGIGMFVEQHVSEAHFNSIRRRSGCQPYRERMFVLKNVLVASHEENACSF